ncbi:DUF805 domain-containing protein [Candidatus Poribacteria bacterium]|nr:DUF805 domain-containing protein [Candidatus Poribacteria bacterium]MYB01521.1 DUF805 domain-containing protein [Candidatus Poribacteria bacterium]
MKGALKYFLYVCFSPKGRINRAWWWLYVALAKFWFYGAIFWTLRSAYYSSNGVFHFSILVLIFTYFGLIYPSIVVCIKRFHDTNRSGWHVLWGLIPPIGGLYILIVCGFFKGTAGDNKYGKPSYLIGDWDSYIAPNPEEKYK